MPELGTRYISKIGIGFSTYQDGELRLNLTLNQVARIIAQLCYEALGRSLGFAYLSMCVRRLSLSP
jgi:hypothetical protein